MRSPLAGGLALGHAGVHPSTADRPVATGAADQLVRSGAAGEQVAASLAEGTEPGLTTAEVEQLFNDVRAELVPFVKKIAAQPLHSEEVLQRHYPKDQQWNYSVEVLKEMGKVSATPSLPKQWLLPRVCRMRSRLIR